MKEHTYPESDATVAGCDADWLAGWHGCKTFVCREADDSIGILELPGHVWLNDCYGKVRSLPVAADRVSPTPF